MSKPFEPYPNAAVSITIAATQARVQLPRGYSTFRLANLTTETIYVKLGDSSVAATLSGTGNLAIPAGVVEVLSLQSGAGNGDYISAIGTGATGTLNITPGVGI